ncbi:TPA: hypothetical protein QHC21_000338 [Raoultella planticola]|nr:hypothetical protein [Raoultella planticola]ALQ45985.1 hypothetical protein ATN83_1864 [Raoultella ornithinolytica]MDU3154997.1 hypothetical protein [Hafnia alvei]MCQ6498849.1 hypothetical protein [Raoultella planticola]HBC8110091.1 hypothetical protein [Raoultella planticola]HBU6971616.1 hypothetical protein [Raoultella planticola]
MHIFTGKRNTPALAIDAPGWIVFRRLTPKVSLLIPALTCSASADNH